MLNYRSTSKRLVVLMAILFTVSCANTLTIYDVKNKEMPAHEVGKKIKVYTQDNTSIEFEIYKDDSTFIYGENDNPKIRKDEIIKIEVPLTKVQKFSYHYIVGGLILTLLSMMFAP